jgi:hypothetical protein
MEENITEETVEIIQDQLERTDDSAEDIDAEETEPADIPPPVSSDTQETETSAQTQTEPVPEVNQQIQSESQLLPQEDIPIETPPAD